MGKIYRSRIKNESFSSLLRRPLATLLLGAAVIYLAAPTQGLAAGRKRSTAPQDFVKVEPLPGPAHQDFPTTGQIEVRFVQTRGFTDAIQTRFLRAAEKLRRVLASDEFKQKVLGFKYQGQRQYVQSLDLTNEQIYLMMLRGREIYLGENNGSMDLNLEFYNQRSSVIGYTSETTRWIYLNWYHYVDFADEDIADNLVHEWLHKLGFDHDFNSTARRPSSVPYAIGGIVYDLMQSLDSTRPASISRSLASLFAPQQMQQESPSELQTRPYRRALHVGCTHGH
jgi:hypothetical protein